MTAIELKKKKKGQKQNVTRGSRVIPQRSTNRAQPSLSSVIGREPELSGWYERSMSSTVLLVVSKAFFDFFQKRTLFFLSPFCFLSLFSLDSSPPSEGSKRKRARIFEALLRDNDQRIELSLRVGAGFGT